MKQFLNVIKVLLASLESTTFLTNFYPSLLKQPVNICKGLTIDIPNM